MELEGRVPEVLSPLEENQGAWDAVTRVLMAVTCQPPPAKEGFVVQTFLPGQGQLTQPGKRPTTWTMVGVGGTLLWPGTQEKSPQCSGNDPWCVLACWLAIKFLLIKLSRSCLLASNY